MRDRQGHATAETVVLWHVLDEDMAEARARLRDFLPGELAELKRACERMTDLIEVVQAEMDGARK